MRIRMVLAGLALVTLLVTVCNSVFMVYDDFFYTIDDLPEGRIVTSVPSPDGTKAIEVYSVNNSLGDGIRCSVKYNDGTSRNIYWQTDCTQTDVRWVNSNYFVDINGQTLHIESQTYDSRKVIEEIVPLVNFVKNKK